MKALLTTCLLAATLGSSLAASAATLGAPARPLARYLTATLHLRRHKARQVQRAIRRNPLALNTPEQVAERLRPVLTAAQYERYTTLQNNVTSYEMLHRLTKQR